MIRLIAALFAVAFATCQGFEWMDDDQVIWARGDAVEEAREGSSEDYLSAVICMAEAQMNMAEVNEGKQFIYSNSFSEFDETTAVNLFKGIPYDVYDRVVNAIIKQHGLLESMKDTLELGKDIAKQRNSVDSFLWKKGGTNKVYYGRVATDKGSDNMLSLAFALFNYS